MKRDLGAFGYSKAEKERESGQNSRQGNNSAASLQEKAPQ